MAILSSLFQNTSSNNRPANGRSSNGFGKEEKPLTFRERMQALRNLPAFFRLVWHTSPAMASANIFLRLIRSAIPLLVLYLGKLIIDQVVLLTQTPGPHELKPLWTLVAAEFKKIGLQPLPGLERYEQSFLVYRTQPGSAKVTVNGQRVEAEKVLVISNAPAIEWKVGKEPAVEVFTVKEGDDLKAKMGEIRKAKKDAILLVDPAHADLFSRYKGYYSHGHVMLETDREPTYVLVLTKASGTSAVTVSATNQVEKLSLNNVAGIIPGKSRRQEMVIFSGHYDHIGTLAPVRGDSIANGADDDASGTTAVISLAKYFKQLNTNERTLVFVAFTAEEMGGYGSQYFSKQLNPDQVVAMFNIEMIGKESKFGKNAAFITGYERSDFGKILQKNLEGTPFTFHPDPYPAQNLFYRSDNATLAKLGVPAHTISTDQIDVDKYYHSVDDEYETLDVANIVNTIRAIALSARSIVAGTDAPTRVTAE